MLSRSVVIVGIHHVAEASVAGCVDIALVVTGTVWFTHQCGETDVEKK